MGLCPRPRSQNPDLCRLPLCPAHHAALASQIRHATGPGLGQVLLPVRLGCRIHDFHTDVDQMYSSLNSFDVIPQGSCTNLS